MRRYELWLEVRLKLVRSLYELQYDACVCELVETKANLRLVFSDFNVDRLKTM